MAYRSLTSGLALMFFIGSVMNGCDKSEVEDIEATALTIEDIDGNLYQTVTIGSQIWMAENLKTSRYNNGDPIAHLIDTTSWKLATEGGWCWHNNVADYDAVFGKLYNARAMDDSRGICPEGWRIPSLEDWHALVSRYDPATLGITEWESGSYTIVSDLAGAQLKDGGLYWIGSDINTNVSGFNALPVGGRRAWDGWFNYQQGIGYFTSFWTSHRMVDQYGSDKATKVGLSYSDSTVNISALWLNQGLCVRCIKEQ